MVRWLWNHRDLILLHHHGVILHVLTAWLVVVAVAKPTGLCRGPVGLLFGQSSIVGALLHSWNFLHGEIATHSLVRNGEGGAITTGIPGCVFCMIYVLVEMNSLTIDCGGTGDRGQACYSELLVRVA